MNIDRSTSIRELLAKLVFLILPTAVILYFLLQETNQYYSTFTEYRGGLLRYLPSFITYPELQALCVLAGMGLGAVFYAFRFRFLLSFGLLVLLLYAIYQGLDRFAVGEFDGFYISVQFQAMAVLFCLGWVLGWGFLRLRYFSVLVAASVLTACIILVARKKIDSVDTLLWGLLPALLYAVYLLFASGQIRHYDQGGSRFWWFMTRRLVFFSLLSLLLMGGVLWFMEKEIRETVANYGGGGQKGDESMLQRDSTGNFDLKQYSQLRASLQRDNQLLFTAHIDNFFEGTDVPNPLYLTSFYYTRFDTLTETFERDTVIPKDDLFEPDPSSIPLFGTRSDSSVIRNAMGPKLRRTVEIEVYSKNLSPKTFLAPSTSFFVQPITVEKDYRKEFRWAFRAKSYVSELNSAYFIYNTPDPQLRAFQQQRFEILRQAGGYEGVDSQFMAYYTRMPLSPRYRDIADLARKVAGGAPTPMDQVLALRDYFLSNDENGEPLFKYSDNPGIPDIPSASRLKYFLFENRQGYCAYFAGATLFMLRALGIPSRIAVGFLTVDRSDKNKGWYWYYADQAHAWVQVYFPGYGWIDFDTTVGNSDARESPTADGTPPLQPPRAWLAAEGAVRSVDTQKQTMQLEVGQYVFHDREYSLQPAQPLLLDLKIASIRRDSVDIPLSQVQPGDSATAVSYAEAFKELKAPESITATALLDRFPEPAPMDEVYIKRRYIKPPADKPAAPPQEPASTWRNTLITAAVVVAGLVLLVFLSPWLLLQYRRLRYRYAQKTEAKAFWAYQTANYYLHLMGVYRKEQTPLQYARQLVDVRLGTRFTGFMHMYLKLKYAGQPLTASEQQQLEDFLPAFMAQVRSRIPLGKRLKGLLSPARMLGYLNRAHNPES